mmetsp:Transcript_31701/g.83142  ORF Transcript_31701/g.83142 Transcript_31701/m.83142 type:complete len:284 (+) Transcript_31701:2089-2940(+)
MVSSNSPTYLITLCVGQTPDHSCSTSPTVSKASMIRFPSTWLWSSGKSAGTDSCSSALMITPTANMIAKHKLIAITDSEQFAIQPTCLKNSISNTGLRSLSAFFRLHPLQEPVLAPDSPCWSFRAARLCILVFGAGASTHSRITRRGGKKSITSANADITQTPMNSPNSRRGCKTLARLAKKLTDVVKEVAKQLLPACVRRNTTLCLTCLQSLLWSQKSTQTKTVSLPMPAIRKSDRNDATVVLEDGARTYATGIDTKIMIMQRRLNTKLNTNFQKPPTGIPM